MLESTGFTYNGINSSVYNIINCRVSSGLFEEPFISSTDIFETVVRNREVPFFQGQKRNPLTFKLVFAIDPSWTTDIIRGIAKWLWVDGYKPLIFDDFPNMVFYTQATGDSNLFHNGAQSGYIELTMRCSSPYAFMPVITQNINNLPATFTRPSTATKIDGTVVASGLPRYEAGQFGQGIMVEEGTTNYVTYSDLSSHVDVTNGTSSIVKATHSINGVNRQGLTWVQGVTTEVVNWSIPIGTLPTTSAQVVTFSADVYCTLTGGVAKGQIKCIVGGTTYYLSLDGLSWTTTVIESSWLFNGYTVAGQWQKISRIFPAFPIGVLSSFNMSGLYRVAENFTFKIADCQVEIKPYYTSLMPTSGAIVTRSAETLTIPTVGVLSPAQGTWEQMVYVPSVLSPVDHGGIMQIPGLIGNGIRFDYRTSGNWNLRTHADDNSYSDGVVAVSTTPMGWHRFAIKWSTTQAQLFIDGISRIILTNPKLPTAFSSSALIGTVNAGAPLNTLYDDLCISSIARTDADMLTRGTSASSLPVDNYTTAKMNFNSSLQSENIYPITNDGDLSIKSEIEITKIGAGDITIANTTTGESFIISGLVDAETVYINCDNETIITDLSGVYRYSNFTGDFLQLQLGTNNIQIIGNANVEIRFERKILQS